MADAVYGLAESDVAILREIVAWWRKSPKNRAGSHDIEPEVGQAPEVYVARTPTAGIPALVAEVGTGVNDEPGYADCVIYQLISGLLQATSGTKRIYNLGAEVAGDAWIFVIRDKWGKWWVLEGETEERELVESVCFVSSDSTSATGTGTGLSTGGITP